MVSFNALHWLPDPRVGVEAARRCLKPQGRAHLRFVGKGPIKSLEAVCEDVRHLPHWEMFFADYQAPFCHLPPEAFPSATMHLEQWDFGSREEFSRWANTTFVAWTSRIPADRHAAFVVDVLDRYSSDRVFTFYQILIEARPADCS